MKFLRKIRENKKGFTLVEILVVLVILAILAAVSIPSMIGFVNDAKGKAKIAEARVVYVAAQSAVTEGAYSSETLETSYANGGDSNVEKRIDELVAGSITTGATYSITVNTGDKKVTAVTYVAGGYTIALDITNGTTTTTKN